MKEHHVSGSFFIRWKNGKWKESYCSISAFLPHIFLSKTCMVPKRWISLYRLSAFFYEVRFKKKERMLKECLPFDSFEALFRFLRSAGIWRLKSIEALITSRYRLPWVKREWEHLWPLFHLIQCICSQPCNVLTATQLHRFLFSQYCYRDLLPLHKSQLKLGFLSNYSSASQLAH